MLYSHNNQYPQPLPFRITLPGGMTRTDPATFTHQELTQAGYVAAPPQPTLEAHQWVTWSSGTWVVHTKTPEQLQQEAQVLLDQQAAQARSQRDQLLQESDWVTIKSLELREPIPQIWVAYRQALRDLTSQAEFPTNIQWPEKP